MTAPGRAAGLGRSLVARAVVRAPALLAVGLAADGCVAFLALRRPGGSALAPLLYGALALAVVSAHGAVDGPLRSGELLLWLQKPGRPVVLMARWLAEVEVLAALLVLALTAGAAAALLVTGRDPGPALARLPALLTSAAVAGAAGFAFSATGLRPDGLVTLAWISLASPFLLLGSMDPSSGRGTGLAELLAFPFDHVGELADAGRGGVAALAGPLSGAAAHLALWLALGLLLATLRCRSPVPSAGPR